MSPELQEAGVWIAGLLLVVGALGIVVPIAPGLLICLAGMLVFALSVGGSVGWVCFAVAVLLFAGGVTLQFLVPGRHLKAQGVGTGTLLLAAALAIVGFFVVPIVGAPLGFVLGIFLVASHTSRDRTVAWTRTKHALKAVATSMGIELLAAFSMMVTFVIGVLLR